VKHLLFSVTTATSNLEKNLYLLSDSEAIDLNKAYDFWFDLESEFSLLASFELVFFWKSFKEVDIKDKEKTNSSFSLLLPSISSNLPLTTFKSRINFYLLTFFSFLHFFHNFEEIDEEEVQTVPLFDRDFDVEESEMFDLDDLFVDSTFFSHSSRYQKAVTSISTADFYLYDDLEDTYIDEIKQDFLVQVAVVEEQTLLNNACLMTMNH